MVSILGRFLEHSRIFYFQSGHEDPLEGGFYIGSADWMRRNLHGRVEVVVPVKDRALKEKLFEILNVTLEDRENGWIQKAQGEYELRPGDLKGGGPQEQLMQLTRTRCQFLEDESS